MYDAIIVGGGPAGMTAGLYAVRAGLKTLLLERELIGGQASTTDKLENYPGFPGGIGGPELMMQFEQQATGLGLEVRYDAVDALELTGEIKRVRLRKETLEARAIILCMGAARRPLGIENEQALIGRGLSYCATCDGAFYVGKTVAVVGGGDTAIEDALYLSQRSQVKLIHRRGALRASGLAAQRALENPSIEAMLGYVVTAAQPQEEGGLLLTLENAATRERQQLAVAGLFVAVGTQPNSQLVAGQVDLDEAGYIVAGEDTCTSARGVYAAGDVREKPLKQVVTAVSDGAVAATMAARQLHGL